MLNRLTVMPEHKGSCGPDSAAGPSHAHFLLRLSDTLV